ncbi:aldehyde oxidase GLOX1 [Lathyrus oleraceus]|nr:aldehyde oxidase GLOX1-like [Pisum sativum]
MQINLMPTNKILVYDATIYRLSRLQYPKGEPCVPYKDDRTQENKIDCFAHSMEYDLATNQVRALKLTQDPWCSCGGLAPDGSLVSSGGFLDGTRTIRHIGGPECKGNCDWREYKNSLQEDRWYGTQTILPTGDFIVIGGRRAFSYEYLPRQEGLKVDKVFFFPFLYETSDLDENNLYPFTHLSTDGNLFIFSNNRSLLLNPKTNKIVRTFPVLPGGSRNYPASGSSALLPIDLSNQDKNGPYKAEVIVCGGNSHDAFYIAETTKTFRPSLKDCNRMVITDKVVKWETEQMPTSRTMGDCLILPNGQLLFINGAQKGTAGWWDADSPNLRPALYSPEKLNGQRFTEMAPTKISRMYHSTSAVLPSGKIWVAGSNTHDTYKDIDKFPTETRVEGFSPPYLDPILDKYRPTILADFTGKNLKYGHKFEIQFSLPKDLENDNLNKGDIKVTMYFPPFTTHGFSMSQRLLVLNIRTMSTDRNGGYSIIALAPPSGEIAPPGYYLLYVVHRGVPSEGLWVHIDMAI